MKLPNRPAATLALALTLLSAVFSSRSAANPQVKAKATGAAALAVSAHDDHPFCEIPRMENEAPRGVASKVRIRSVQILNSRPSAVATLYVDFDGEVVSDPAWANGQTIDAQAYALSATDIATIIARVGEDYAPFDINVTTDVARYNAAPVGRRMRCIVTPTTTAAPGSGGVAYFNSFAQAGKNFSTTIPCWVFNRSIRGISEALSHEFGHTFGLAHDGRTSPVEEYFEGYGTNGASPISWAPLMGISYYSVVTQWSKGEYPFASQKQDDLAIIANATNGFGYAPDEAGSAMSNAAPLRFSSGGAVAQPGLITTALDADCFAFNTSGGAVSLNAAGAAPLPNLDIALELRDLSGAIIAADNPGTALNASISTTLDAGTYFLTLKGSSANDGISNYTSYGSLGAYTLSGTIPVAAPVAPQAYTWTGGDGNWNDPAKWSPTGVPQAAGDSATFNGGTGTVTLSQLFSPDSITVNTGASYKFAGLGGLSGSGTLTSNGTLTLVNGQNYYSGATLADGGTLRFSVGNFTESLGTLQLSNGANVNVVFAANTAPGALKFADSSGLAWNGSLIVNGYRGSGTGLFIGAGQTLSSSQLAQISFIDPNNSTGTFAAKQLASGEIVPGFAPGASSGAIISEFRFRGPKGAGDEFIEIYNTQSAPLNIGGWTVRTQTASGIQNTLILEGTTLPARGHFLITGSTYSLGGYGTGDQTLNADALDNSGAALLNPAGETQDAVGFASSDAALREGGGLPDVPVSDEENAFARTYVGAFPKNTVADSSQDFVLISNTGASTAGTPAAIASQLGAPSPHGLKSPFYLNNGITTLLLDGNAGANVSPNRVRTGSGDSGTLLIRRTFLNKSGKTLTRVRFVVTRITSLGSPGSAGSPNPIAGQADVRLITSSDATVTTSGGAKAVSGTTLEAATNQPAQPLGGALGSTVSFNSVLATPLPSGESRSYSFLLEVKKSGSFAVSLNIEALPSN